MSADPQRPKKGLHKAGTVAWAFVVILAVSACATSQRHPSLPVSNTQPPQPATTTDQDGQPGQTAQSGQPGKTDSNAPAQTTGAATSAPSGGTAPSCSCVEVKAKPRPKPRPKPALQEAPPQLPTAPVVEKTPPGGLIDAQVRSMGVSVMSILGKRVRGANGEDLGRVVDVLADASGRVRTAIIDFGGFLGVGNHRVAVDWPLLRFSPDGSDPSLLLSLSPDKLRTAPEYKENPRPQILMVPTASTAAPAE